jgi:hypothetical protein
MKAQMKRILILLAFGFSLSVSAQYEMIVSAEEMIASNNAPPALVAKALPVKDAPLIELVTPKLPGVVASPTPIELKFKSFSSSNVRPDSFRALYGTFEIDITKKLLSVAKVTEVGVVVPEAALPKGKHKILLIVEDTVGRMGSRLIEFEVN